MELETILERIRILDQEVKNLSPLVRKVRHLGKENTFLEERLSHYENPKNSRNSSIPTRKDENRPQRNQSLRKSTGKKPGGQKGRKGNTLEMVENPDTVIDLVPDFCNNCDSPLENSPIAAFKSRQIVDLPKPKAIFTEYRSYAKSCTCGCTTRADFPPNVCATICYGPRIESLIGYYHTRQYLTFARMKEMFNDVFNIGISEGGLHYLLEKFSRKTDAIYQQIKEEISLSDVIGVDETEAKVNGSKKWFWTWQNEKLTSIAYSENLGFATIEREFPNGLPYSTIVRDGRRA